VNVWLEVRCCCVPERRLGFLQVDPVAARRHDPVVFRPRQRSSIDPNATPEYPPRLRVTLPIRHFSEWDQANERYSYRPALSSHDTPIEVLRAIEGFVEAEA
jgi:hypothetical protein